MFSPGGALQHSGQTRHWAPSVPNFGSPFPVFPHGTPDIPFAWQSPSGVLQWIPHTFSSGFGTLPLPSVDLVPDRPSPGPTDRVQIHPNLSGGRIDWDVSYAPSAARPRQGQGVLEHSGPAIRPEFRKITIEIAQEVVISEWVQRWGRLRVRAPDSGGITVQHIMDAIYTYFHEPLTYNDLHDISERGRQRLMQSYGNRMNSSSQQHHNPDRQYRRVDLLNGWIYFQSIRQVSFRGDHCRVSLSLGCMPA